MLFRSLQAKILRTMQEKEIRRVGGRETIKIDARFIAATNKSLESLIETGNFRQDLYYRLNTATLSLPPLRERKEDILLFTDYFLKNFESNSFSESKELDKQVVQLFLDYDWPGNRSEEHTSELQSHSFISYAVFCLKKKKKV